MEDHTRKYEASGKNWVPRSLLVRATTHRCSSYIDLNRELWSRVDQKNRGKRICLSKSLSRLHNLLVVYSPIRYSRRTTDSQIVFNSSSRYSVAKIPMKPEMGTLLFRTVVPHISPALLQSFALESSSRAGLYHNVWLTTCVCVYNYIHFNIFEIDTW